MSQSNPFYKLIKELSDIFGEWEDVMDTAYELEQLLTDGMSQLANFDSASIADDVQQGLSEIKEKLEDANLLDGLGDQIQEALKDLKDQVNIDLEAPFDVPDIGDLSNLKELIGKYLPDVPGVDFGPMTDAFTKLMNLIDLPDIDVALRKTSGGSYPEGIEAAAQSAMQAAIPPTTPSNINTAQTATNGTSNAATGTPPNNDWLQAMIPDWKTHEEAIEGLMTKLESAFDELAIMDQVQASMDKLMPQIEQLKTVADITPILTTLIKDVGSEVAPALKKVLDIFTEAFEDFKKLLISLKAAKLPKDLNANQWYQLLTFGGGKEPGLLTIPCLVLALPLCFMSKALTGKRPELGGVFQSEELYGTKFAVGIMEILVSLLGLVQQLYINKKIDQLKDSISTLEKTSKYKKTPNDTLTKDKLRKSIEKKFGIQIMLWFSSLVIQITLLVVIIKSSKKLFNSTDKGDKIVAKFFVIMFRVISALYVLMKLFYVSFIDDAKYAERLNSAKKNYSSPDFLIHFILTVIYIVEYAIDTPKELTAKLRSSFLAVRHFILVVENGFKMKHTKVQENDSDKETLETIKKWFTRFGVFQNVIQITRGSLMLANITSPPKIHCISVANDNSYVKVTFSENVVGTRSDKSFNTSDFILTISNLTGLQVTVSSVEGKAQEEITIYFSIRTVQNSVLHIPNGQELLSVNLHKGRVKDEGGNVASPNQSNNEILLNNESN